MPFCRISAAERLLGELRVALLERIDAAFGIDHRLLPGEVRVARGAGVDSHLLFGGTGLDDITARAGNRGVAIGGMNVFLHVLFFLVMKFSRLPMVGDTGFGPVTPSV